MSSNDHVLVMIKTKYRAFLNSIRCRYRPIILVSWGLLLLCTFWFATRYPSLLEKLHNVNLSLPSMAFDHNLMSLEGLHTLWQMIFASSLSWLSAMAIGMSFGVLFGALLHTIIQYYPLKIGKNLYLNSLKGALVGAPMGVCANCAVPMACGITRGKGRVEVALGYLFSSPNLNPIVVVMTFSALPIYFGLFKYVVVLLVIVIIVPMLISWLERKKTFNVFTVESNEICTLPDLDFNTRCTEKFSNVFAELAKYYIRHIWMLLKPTITIMFIASILAGLLLNLIPLAYLLDHVTPAHALLVSFLSVFMPVPIALDVMFAAQLQSKGVAPGYVLLFLMTLGT